MTTRVTMRPVYLPLNIIGGMFAGPIAWEADFDFPGAERQEVKPLLSVAELAKALGVSRTTANAMTNDGTIPAKTIRGRKKVRRDDLEGFLKHGAARRKNHETTTR
jgi:excisionase family DNA binding protein